MLPSLQRALERFDLGSLEASLDSVYVVDGELRLRFVNEGYRRFAEQSGGGEVLARYPLGTSILDAFAEPLRSHFEERFREATHQRKPVSFDYHCPTPEAEQHFRAMAYPLQGQGLLFVHGPIARRAWTDEDLLELHEDRSQLLRMCAGCRRVQANGAWFYVRRLLETPPGTATHGLCPTCVAFYLGAAQSGTERH